MAQARDEFGRRYSGVLDDFYKWETEKFRKQQTEDADEVQRLFNHQHDEYGICLEYPCPWACK